MAELVRFGVAMDRLLLERFDRHVEAKGYANRSEALRDLVRAELDQASWETGAEAVATLTFVYDHHVRELTEKLNEIQHDHGSRVISTLHVHLDHDQCLEVIVARGPAELLQRMFDTIVGTKGVLSGRVHVASVPGA